MTWVIEQLDRRHERTGFSCGKPSLDDFLTKYASQYEKRHLARTYVAVCEGETRALGYYCLSAYGVPFENWPSDVTKQLPDHPIPIALLGRLAVDQSVRGQGLGGHLLRDALKRCLNISEQLGVFAVLVEAIDEEAIHFYERFGFVAFADQPDKLYLPISTIPKA
jgi:GNAT superfamily N-acetyltransferase